MYQDETNDTQSNIHLCLKEFPRAKPKRTPEGEPKRTPEGEEVYLIVYPESSPNMDSISFQQSLPQ